MKTIIKTIGTEKILVDAESLLPLPIRRYNYKLVRWLTGVFTFAMIFVFTSVFAPRCVAYLKPQTYSNRLVTVTTYQNVESQCDETPNIAASGFNLSLNKQGHFIAISQDLLNEYHYGDVVNLITGDERIDNEQWVIVDCMNKRYTKCVDVLTSTFNTKIQKCVIKKI